MIFDFLMNKKLLVFAVGLLFTAQAMLAQTFEFRYHGESLADGATVTIEAEEDEWGFGEMGCYTNPSSDPNNGLILKLLSGNPAEGTANLVIEENTLNPSRLLWCMGGNCMNLGSNTNITKTFSFNNGICLTQFDAEDIQSEGSLLATLTATIGSETHTVKIKFTYGAQGGVTGDVNGDGSVTSADITAIYDYMLTGDTTHATSCDVDGDGSITSADVTAVYSILLGN